MAKFKLIIENWFGNKRIGGFFDDENSAQSALNSGAVNKSYDDWKYYLVEIGGKRVIPLIGIVASICYILHLKGWVNMPFLPFV